MYFYLLPLPTTQTVLPACPAQPTLPLLWTATLRSQFAVAMLTSIDRRAVLLLALAYPALRMLLRRLDQIQCVIARRTSIERMGQIQQHLVNVS